MYNERIKFKRHQIPIFVFLIMALFTVTACSAGNGNGSIQGQTGTADKSSVMQEPSAEGQATIPGQSGMNTGSVTSTGNGLPQETDTADCGPVQALVAGMSLEEKIGQLFIVGFSGVKADDGIKSMIRKYHVGGIILFRNNITDPGQLLALTNSLKDLNSINKAPLFMSVDEEGGRITRMPDQLHKLPSNETIGKMNNSRLSYDIGSVLANELKSFGFNMDFAPVMDIFSNPQNTVIGDRAFGTEPGVVCELGVQTMKGIRAGGIISVVKHFPGHGDTLVDSHKGLPVVEYGMERLKSFELKPFQTAIDNNAEAVMVAHILMKAIDPENPASMSNAMITDILRGQMGFRGVVATDDMTMGAVTANYAIGDAVVRSVNAGSDLILVCHGSDNQLSAINSLKEAVRDGRISMDRLNESVCRVLSLKEKYKLTDKKTASADVDSINKAIDSINKEVGS